MNTDEMQNVRYRLGKALGLDQPPAPSAALYRRVIESVPHARPRGPIVWERRLVAFALILVLGVGAFWVHRQNSIAEHELSDVDSLAAASLLVL